MINLNPSAWDCDKTGVKTENYYTVSRLMKEKKVDKTNQFKLYRIFDNLELKKVFDVKNILKYFLPYMKTVALSTEY